MNPLSKKKERKKDFKERKKNEYFEQKLFLLMFY
jgi:hypothetical protein